MKKDTAQNLLPISKKFYVEIGERVHSAIDAVASVNYGVSFYQVMETIDAYLYCEIIPDCAVNPDARLIFHLLQPEIDKAIRRSSRAREAAARRRELKKLAEIQEINSRNETTGTAPVDETPTPAAIQAPETAGSSDSPETENKDAVSEINADGENGTLEPITAENQAPVKNRSKRRRNRRHGRRKKQLA